MSKHVMLVATAASAVVLAACVVEPPRGPAGPRGGEDRARDHHFRNKNTNNAQARADLCGAHLGRCQVNIIPHAGCSSAPSALEADPDYVITNRQGAYQIEFTIAPGDPWRFDGYGIKFKGDPAELKEVPGQASDKRRVFTNAGRTPGTYRYAIRVVGAQGEACERDPTVVNDW